MAMQLDDFEAPAHVSEKPLHEILEELTRYAAEQSICDDNSTARELFDTKLMGILTPRPSQVQTIDSEFPYVFARPVRTLASAIRIPLQCNISTMG